MAGDQFHARGKGNPLKHDRVLKVMVRRGVGCDGDCDYAGPNDRLLAGHVRLGMKMTRFNAVWLILMSGAVVATGGLPASFAATSPNLDASQLSDEPSSVDVRVGAVRPLSLADESQLPPRGNPLWSVPLSVLTATKERPIFSASRRPPARAVVAPPVEQVTAPVANKASEPERPALALIGTVVGDGDAIAIFLDRSSMSVLRLRRGDINAGWSVDSILKGEVVLARASQTEAFVLQPPDSFRGSATPRSR
jgi:general secretion pathway protein N